jgi:Plavaka transposase
MSEHLELRFCDPVEWVKELIGNPAFKDFISYVPECVYIDDEGKVRVYDEMWTSNWWWETQV